MRQHPHFEVFEELGRGDQTIVFRGYDLTLSREVAIKVLPNLEGRDPRSRQRFLRQAQFLAQHDHDHVLRIHSVEPDYGWIIMELMQDTLSSRIRKQECDPDQVRSILRQILSALDFLHTKQKIHGSIRPSNILINELGRVKLSDFEEVSADGELSIPTGSKKYLAPELIRPDLGRCGPELDLYCLAFTSLELLVGPHFDDCFPGTGRDAIDRDLAWLRWHNSDEELPSMRDMVPNIPEDLAHVLQHMLQKQVQKRPSSAAQVLMELADRPLVFLPQKEKTARPSEVAVPKTTVRELAPLAAFIRNSTTSEAEVRPSNPSEPFKSNVKRPSHAGKSLTQSQLYKVLGKSFVLYPLCGFLFFGILWAGWPRPKPELLTKAEHPASTEETEQAAIVQSAEATTMEVTFSVTPPDAELHVSNQIYRLDDGMTRVHLASGQAHAWRVIRQGFEPKSGEIPLSTGIDDGKEASSHTIRIELKRSLPTLPRTLIAKPGSGIHVYWKLPERALVRALNDAAPLEMVLVSPGDYSFGVPAADAYPWELPACKRKITSPFYLAEYETTTEQFEIFSKSHGKSSGSAANPRMPLTGITPPEAEAFCQWIGGRLPSELEWEAAMRGQDDSGYPHPWRTGDGFLPTNCHLFRGSSSHPFARPVDELPGSASPLGFYHALGNAAEWCRKVGPDPTPQENGEATPVGLTLDDYIIRGCSFATPEGPHARITWRSRPDSASQADVGFRAAVFVSVQPIQPLFADNDKSSSPR